MACGLAGERLPVLGGHPPSLVRPQGRKSSGTHLASRFLCFLFLGQRARALGAFPGWVLSPSGWFGYFSGISGRVCFVLTAPHSHSSPKGLLLLHLTSACLIREAAHCQRS